MTGHTLTNIIPNWRTTFNNGEIEAIASAIASECISQGPIVSQFEDELAKFLDMPYVVATTSGSTALLMALLSAGIGPGDEVILPNRTWIATAHAPYLLGASVKLVDVELGRPILDAQLLEAAISEKTRAIIPVHMGGRSADMQQINKIAKKYNLLVIEDAAQALGSQNDDGFLGTQSDIGCFSFSVAKIISTGQGGFVTTRCSKTYERLVSMRTQGVGDIINASWNSPGFNFRFTDILASIGRVQLRLLSMRIEKVKALYRMYEEGLRGLSFISLIPVDISKGEVPVYVEALCERRQELINFLSKHGVQCRPFYPDLNFAEYFQNSGEYPNSRIFGLNGLYLPAGPEQSKENIELVISLIHRFGSD